jgi:PAS domain S-box-containing protein
MANQLDYIFFFCGLAFLLLAAMVWARSHPERAGSPGKWSAFFAALKSMREISGLGRWLMPAVVVLLSSGFLITNWCGQIADAEQHAQLIREASTIARQISVVNVEALSFTAADQATVNFQRLHRQMMEYARLVGLRSLYSMAVRDGRIVFGPGSLVVNAQEPLVPGTVYEKPPAELGELFHSHHAQIVGPYTDEFGSFVSAFAPVIDSQTGKTLLVIGMDIEAGAWQARIAHSRQNSILFTLMLLLMILAGSILMAWRNKLSTGQQGSLRHAEVWLTVVFGLLITLSAAYMANDDEARSRRKAFSQMAEAQAWNVVEAMLNLRDFQLEGLGLSLSDDEEISRREFKNYTAPLVRSGIAQAWEWIPAVPAGAKLEVEEAAQRDGLTDFTLYEKDLMGRSVPAEGRDVYYPVYYVEPLAGNERALGYDLGSESMRRAALEEATQTGRPTATGPITLVQETGTQQGAIIYRPVYVGEERATTLRGFALVVLRFGAMLDHILPHVDPDSSVVTVNLFQTGGDKPPRLLASSSPEEAPGGPTTENQFEFVDGADLAFVAPLFAFGKTYVVLVHPGAAFLTAHSRRAGWAVGVAGLVLIALLALFVDSLANRRTLLETQVHARTAELKENTALLTGLLDCISDIVFFKDGQGIYLGCNSEFVRLVGRPREDIIGHTDYDLFPREVADFFRMNDREMMVTQASRHNEEWVDYPDGSRALLDTLKSPLRNADGWIVGVLGVSRDITERKDIEERLQLAIRAAEVGIWDWDVVNDRLTWDAAMYRLYGIAPEQFSGTYGAWEAGLHPEDLQESREAIQRTLRGEGEFNPEFRVIWPDGSIHFIKANGVIQRDSEANPLRMIGTNWDITTQKLAVASAETANLAKSAFLANMSHEIRTPLNAILGFSQLLQRDPALTLQQKEQIGTVNRSGEHLLTLINDILEMSKIEAGHAQLNPDEFDFHALFEESERMFGAQTQEKGLMFQVNRIEPVSRYLYADSGKIRQILMNVLGNAVKFTLTGGITVRVWSDQAQAGEGDVPVRVTIEVTDTGPGIAPDEMDRVFEPFEQTQSGRYEGRGTGLGMPISRQYARMMGGDLTLASEVAKGSTFRFAFVAKVIAATDFEATAALRPQRVVGLKPGYPAPRVLVVDDNDANREVLRRLLESVGFEVREALGGREAVAISEEWRPAMVLMDRRMPEMDGLEATRAIKTSHWGQDTRIVIVTAGVLEGDEQECFQGGADGYIAKPYKETEVLAVIGSLIEVDFAYEETEMGLDSSTEACRAAVAELPANLRAELIEATESGDISQLLHLIKAHVTMQGPPLGKKLRQLARDYDYATILEMLRRP